MVDNIAHESNTANECTSMHVPEIPKVRNEVNPSQEDHDVKPSEQLEKPLSLKELNMEANSTGRLLNWTADAIDELYQMEVRKLKVLGGDGERGYLPNDALLELPESLGKNGSINAIRVFQNALSEEVMLGQESGSMQRPTFVHPDIVKQFLSNLLSSLTLETSSFRLRYQNMLYRNTRTK
ncbi:unnamed protein product [Malus baccata var. baccata]